MRQRVTAILPRIFVIVVVVVILGAALGAGSALAAKGGIKGKPDGNGNGNGNGGSTTATVFAEPNPADAGSVVRVKGCGYENDRAVEVRIEHATYTEAYGVWVWADGCIDFPLQTAEPGTYGIKAYQHAGHKMILKAEGTLEVQP